jgi:hypothetical protein
MCINRSSPFSLPAAPDPLLIEAEPELVPPEGLEIHHVEIYHRGKLAHISYDVGWNC